MHGRRALAVAVCAVVVWLLLGALFYYLIGNCSVVPRIDSEGNVSEFKQCPWTFAQSFYYSIQTGLSIGFGLLSESSDASRLFSIYHILAGSSFISGALSLFAQLALQKSTNFQNREERRLAKFSASVHADGYKGFKLPELRQLMVTYPHYMKDVIIRLYKDTKVVEQKMKTFKAATLWERRQMVDTVLKEACEKLEEFKNGELAIKDLAAIHAREGSWRHKLSLWYRAHRNFVNTFLVFLLWLVIGVLFEVLADKQNFVTGLYFAVSTLSTAGLQAVNTVESGWHVTFAAFYAIIGVPIYGIILGSFANLLVERYSQRKFEDTMHKKFSSAELEFLEHMTKTDHRDDVDVNEFVEIQLLRLGLVDRETLESLRNQFDELDKNSSGRIAKSTFIKRVLRSKEDEDGEAETIQPDAEASPMGGAADEQKDVKR